MSKRGVAGGLMRKPTQRDEVLAYMRTYGSISSFEAYEELGITQLGARIHELKALSFAIGTVKKSRVSERTGKIINYVEYFLQEVDA